MKRTLLLLILGAVLTCPSFTRADSTNAPPSGPPPGGFRDKGLLTPAEQQELKSAHDAAVQADPTLETEGKNLWEQMKAAHESGEKPSADLVTQMHAYRKKLDAAMIKADTNVAPIIAKLEAAHHGGPGGPPPPPPGA